MLTILYQDDQMLAVDKPPGLLTTPSPMASDRVTCMSLLRDQIGSWVYPVHRLDRATSGVLLFGRDSASAGRIAVWFRERQARKAYLALVRGWVEPEGEIDHPVEGAHPGERVEALTRYRCLGQIEFDHPVGRYTTARYSLVEASPVTGRRHQIRRHFKHLRHPLLGDPEYGDTHHNRFFRERYGLRRLMLHAWLLEVPEAGLRIQAPVPQDMRAILEDLGMLVPTG